MPYASREAERVAAKFIKREAAKSPLTFIGIDLFHRVKGRRITTDGNNLLSYEWWNIAFFHGDDLYITMDRYQTGEWKWKSGKPKYSSTTDGHIYAAKCAARAGGYRETEETKIIEGLGGDRTYRKYERVVNH